jgi:phosphatidylserine/phosphatidylglycerophosphate/cardiolipin synthase-like enzyme
MAKFLNTSATNYYLEEMIKRTRERLIIISPFLKFNDRIKELLEDKDRLKIDVRIVYGKSELSPHEINWLRSLEFIRTSFCQNLHAKCYINEEAAIISSMNLYDFSQVNNNEMGVYIRREDEGELFRETYDEAQRLIRISEQVRLAAEKVVETPGTPASANNPKEDTDPQQDPNSFDKLSTSRLAKLHGARTSELLDRLVEIGYLKIDGDKHYLTELGKKAGGEFHMSKKFGPYFLWPKDISLKGTC